MKNETATKESGEMNNNPVTELNNILANTFGNTVKGVIARAPMWGHSDNCWVLYGKQSVKAASLIASKLNAKMTVERTKLGTTVTLVFA